MQVTNRNGKQVDFDAAVELMDNGIREQVHAYKSPCTEQEFFTAYEIAHAAVYGEDWELSKANPVW